MPRSSSSSSFIIANDRTAPISTRPLAIATCAFSPLLGRQTTPDSSCVSCRPSSESDTAGVSGQLLHAATFRTC